MSDCAPQHEDSVNSCVQRPKELLGAEWLPEERRDQATYCGKIMRLRNSTWSCRFNLRHL
jgi:hypothetical protein